MTANDIPVQVYAGNIISAGMVKTYLESAGIKSYLKDELMGTLNPWFVAPGGAGSVKVMVASSEAGNAIELVKAFEANLR